MGYVGTPLFKGTELTSICRLREGGPGSGPHKGSGGGKLDSKMAKAIPSKHQEFVANALAKAKAGKSLNQAETSRMQGILDNLRDKGDDHPNYSTGRFLNNVADHIERKTMYGGEDKTLTARNSPQSKWRG